MGTLVKSKPILVLGFGLGTLLLLWDGLDASWASLGQWGLGGLSLLGWLAWTLRSSSPQTSAAVVTALTQVQVDQELKFTRQYLAKLTRETPALEIGDLTQKLEALPPEGLRAAIIGEKGCGKSSLLSLLQNTLVIGEIQWREYEQADADSFYPSEDLLLWVVSGDLSASAWQVLKRLHSQHHTLLLVFNKQDQYSPSQRAEIIQQLHHVTASLSLPIIPLSASPQAITVRRHLADGTQEEFPEQPSPDWGTLLSTLQAVIAQNAEHLGWARTWRNCRYVQRQAHERLNQHRRGLALPIIERYQWLAGGATFLNPVATVDLLLIASLNAQMALDLGNLYQQKLSLAQARTLMATLGEVMLKLGVVELSTQAVGSLLKSQPLTYSLGGLIQGTSAAYLTRIAGLSLIEYWQQQIPGHSQEQKEILQQIVRELFQRSERLGWLPPLVQNSLARFGSLASPG